jgi:hypothetical protein
MSRSGEWLQQVVQTQSMDLAAQPDSGFNPYSPAPCRTDGMIGCDYSNMSPILPIVTPDAEVLKASMDVASANFQQHVQGRHMEFLGVVIFIIGWLNDKSVVLMAAGGVLFLMGWNKNNSAGSVFPWAKENQPTMVKL